MCRGKVKIKVLRWATQDPRREKILFDRVVCKLDRFVLLDGDKTGANCQNIARIEQAVNLIPATASRSDSYNFCKTIDTNGSGRKGEELQCAEGFLVVFLGNS